MYERRVLTKRLLLVITPLILSPLLFFSKQIQCVFVILLMCLYWLFDVAPFGVVSLLPLFLFPVMNIVPAEDLSEKYFSDSNALFLCSLFMAMAVEEVALHKRIALTMLLQMGSSKLRALFGFLCVTAFISFAVSDTACTALSVPICLAILQTLHDAKGKKKENGDAEKAKDKTFSLDKMSESDRGFCKAMILGCTHGSLIGGTGVITGTGPNIALLQFTKDVNLSTPVTYLTWSECSLPPLFLYLTLDFLILVIVFMGPTTLFCCKQISDEDKKTEDIIGKAIRQNHEELGPIKFSEWSVAIFFILAILGWSTRDFGQTKGWDVLFEKDMVSETTYGILLTFLLFVWPKDIHDPTLTPILTWDTVKRKMTWSVILLIGSGYAMKEGVNRSGLDTAIGCQMKEWIGEWKAFYVQVVLVITVGILTQFTSNVTTANIFIPIFMNVANAISINPLYLAFPATMACSFAFLFPMSSPPNAIVYETGIISMWEMVSTGFLVALFCNVVNIVNMNTYAFWLMDMSQASLGEFNVTNKC